MTKDEFTQDEVMALGLQAAGDTAYVWDLKSDALTLAGQLDWIAGEAERDRNLSGGLAEGRFGLKFGRLGVSFRQISISTS